MDNPHRTPANEDEDEQDLLCALTSDVNVLISGGDDRARASLARMIYAHSERRGGRFVTLDRAEPSWRLLDGDTLFVEELTELTPAMRDELMRWLEGTCGRSSGGRAADKPRIIAATADDRPDRLPVTLGVPATLFYRLNTIHLALTGDQPPRWVM